MDTQVQLANSKEHIRIVSECVSKLKDVAERMVGRSATFATDMLQMGRQFGLVLKILPNLFNNFGVLLLTIQLHLGICLLA